MRTSLFARLVENESNRSSPPKSGRPSALQSRCQNFSFAHATIIQPSAVSKAWNGTIEGCAEWRVLSETRPPLRYHVAGYVNIERAESKRLTSQSEPIPS